MDYTSTKDNMEYYENRLKTFDTYPKQMLPDKMQLARAGLYYKGKSDVCHCFRCHVKLSAWEREIYIWSHQCKYIKMVGSPSPRSQGFTLRSNASAFEGFGTGSSNMEKSLHPKTLVNWNEIRDEPL